MKKIRLIDACFPGNPSSIAGDNVWRGPQHFEWCREECDSLYTWFTNWTLHDPILNHYPKVIAWLLEPHWGFPERGYSEEGDKLWPYVWVAEKRNWFDTILTYDKGLLNSGDSRFKFAPHGGSWIDWDLWGVHEKTKDVCMIVSDKKDSEGHKLRHQIAKEFGDRIDVYGPSYQKFDRKFDVLKDYRYCVVVESVRMDYYFSEKLIDAISVGCYPIYWGCPSIGSYFNLVGLDVFGSIDTLSKLLPVFDDKFYQVSEKPLIQNIERAKQYRMPEDWMFEHYPELFK